MVIEVNESSLVNMIFAITGFFDVFGCNGHGNRAPAVLTFLCTQESLWTVLM